MDNTEQHSLSSFYGRFRQNMEDHFGDIIHSCQGIAVGVSGGPDSMALCHLLSQILGDGQTLYAITVDHRLRKEAAHEAAQVGELLSSLHNVKHVTLQWGYEAQPESRIQERAREARYHLMTQYMKDNGVSALFTAHHLDDQAETFLFRLSKGSGLDGLSAMPFRNELHDDFYICRPLLNLSKNDILQFCRENSLSYINDPSNQSDAFARVRLRKSMDVLKEEGLTPKRLGVTATRMLRAREALDFYAARAGEQGVILKDSDRVVFDCKLLLLNPFEVVLRVISAAMKEVQGNSGQHYGVRMEKLEALCEDLLKPNAFRKRTLGKVIFERNDKTGELILSKER
ncbi:MAG: tRNA lysidine(34) synthetase TilS [Alcanivorax sp.]